MIASIVFFLLSLKLKYKYAIAFLKKKGHKKACHHIVRQAFG